MATILFKKSVVGFATEPTGKLTGLKTRFKGEELEEYDRKGLFSGKRVGFNTDFSLLELFCMMGGLRERKISVKASRYGVLAADMVCGKVNSYAAYTGKDTIQACDLTETEARLPFSEKHKGSVLTAAIIGFLYGNNPDFSRVVDEIFSYPIGDLNDDFWDDELAQERLMKQLCYITNCLYYYFKDNYTEPKVGVINLFIEGIELFDDAGILFGSEEERKEAKKKASEPMRVVRGKFLLDKERKLSPLEESMVPNLPDTFVSEPVIESICRDIVDSSAFEQPFRNVLLYGDSGGGKTSIAKAIAEYLGLPYAKVTFSPDTDKIEIVGSILPNTDKTNTDELFKKLNIPTFEDVDFDFEGSFEKLFGRKPGRTDDRNDCYKKMTELMMSGISQSEDFVFVPSNIVQGAQNGWVVEIQEAALLKRESELCTINALLENVPGTSITLPTGKEIFRHPDSVFVFTTNMDYKGCKSLQQSVLSRCNIKREIKTPTAEVMAERALAQMKTPKEFGAPKFKKGLVEKMARVCKEIASYSKDHDISDGVCGVRELNDWTKKALLLAKADFSEEVTEKHVVYAAWVTILEKCSQNPEEMEEIVTAVFQKTFSQEDVELGRELYYAGEL